MTVPTNFHSNVKTIEDCRQAFQRIRVFQQAIDAAVEDVSDAITAIAAEDVTFDPAGDISATDVQTALEELDDDKASETNTDEDARKFRALLLALVDQGTLECPPSLETDLEQADAERTGE